MNLIAKIFQKIKDGIIGVRMFGSYDVFPEVMCGYNEDISPTDNHFTVVIPTNGEMGKSVAVGFVEDGVAKIAQEGEKRIYAVSTDGKLLSEVHLKNDGSILLKNDQGTFSLGSNGDVTVSNNLIISGSVNIQGSLNSSGVITSTQDVQTGPISLRNHKHPYTDDGNPVITGVPIP